MTDLTALANWLNGYERAWRSNDAHDIAELFTAQAVYRYHPWADADDRVVGRDAIVASWLENPDDPQSWTLTCEPLAVNGSLGIARCVTGYAPADGNPARTYHNIWLVDLDDTGRCREFVEYYQKEPDARDA
jgi:SnoaL-like domain